MVDEEIGMPAKRELSMRQLRHLLRLHHDGVSAREIGRRLGVARSTIQDNLKRAAAAGLAWPLADDVTDEALETRLFGRAGVTQGQRRRAEPDWAALARELKRPGVTMTILWEEYRRSIPKATATAVMLRPGLCGVSQGEGWCPWHEPQHKFEQRRERL